MIRVVTLFSPYLGRGDSRLRGANNDPQFETLEQRKQYDAYIFFHEFLYIVCNAQNRVEQIQNNHKMNLKSQFYPINLPELDNTYYEQENNVVTHIHLLNPDFREDKRPARLVSNALDFMADTCKWKYQGAQAERKAKYTDYSLRDLFGKRLQDKIDKYNI